MWTLALFAAIQLADGVLTASGVSQYGASVEANPLLNFSVGLMGVGATVVAAKFFAVCCGTLLHLRAKHLTLAILTVGYVLIAIVPWMWTMSWATSTVWLP